MVEQRAAGIELGFHARQHVIDSGERDDCLAELHTFLGVGKRLVVSLLLHPHALGSDAQAGTVHQRHHIFNKSKPRVAAQLGPGVLVNQLTGGRAVNTQLVLDVAHVHAAVTLVVDEHRQSSSVGGALFAAGKHQVDVAVAVGDKAFHAVEPPGAVGILGGLEHDALEVAAGIGLGEVHRHALAGANTGNEPLALVVVPKLVEGVDAALQAPDVLETGVGARNHLAQHREHHVGQVQAAIASRHRHAVQPGFAGSIEILQRLAGVHHAAVHQVRPLLVHALAVGLDDGGGHLAGNFQHAPVVLDGIIVVDGCIGIGGRIGEIALSQLHNALHERMVQVKTNLGTFGIIVVHRCVLF